MRLSFRHWTNACAISLLATAAMQPFVHGLENAPSTTTADALLDAARRDDTEAVKGLLGTRADVNATSNDGTTALAWAVMHSNEPMTSRLLAAGANPNLSNTYGVTPLHVAIENAAVAIVPLLLAKGANVNTARANGETPLMTAARIGQSEIVKLLLTHHADVNAREKKFGQTALMWAAGNPAVVRLLVDAGADLRLTSNSWEVKATIPGTSFRTVGATGVPWVFEGDYVSKKGGQNALHFAVQERNLESARLLLDAGLDVNSISADHTTPLLLALYKWDSADGRSVTFAPDLPMANLLLERGAGIKSADDQGYTPLHGAVLATTMTTSRPRGRGGRAGGAAAARGGRPIDGAAGPSPSRADWMQLVTRLLDAGADPNAAVINPTTAGLGTRLNPPTGGSTPLHIAAASTDVPLVQLLCLHGANPTVIRKDGLSPFALAVQSDNVDVVKALVAAGADVRQRYNPYALVPDPVEAIALRRQSQTIMHVAALAHSSKSIEYLFSLGVSLTDKNAQDETPLEAADNQEVFEYVLAYEGVGAGGGIWRPRDFTTSDTIKRLLGKPTMASFSNGIPR
jgi:ankyrin repeat protein